MVVYSDCPICSSPKTMTVVSASLDQSKVIDGISDVRDAQQDAWTINYKCRNCSYKETRKNVGAP